MADDIPQWLDSLGLGQYAQAFADNGIDIEALPHLRDEDFERLGVLLGHMRRLQAAIETRSADEAATRPAAPPGKGPEPRPAEAERRQLTVMFVDLVGSTALSQQLDPEDLREVLRAYHEMCAESVGCFEGHIAKYIGDGLLIYFGYPQAHEDDPVRAMRAGLGIVQSVAGLNQRLREAHGVELSVRVGIHTGLVVVGEMGVGETREADAIVGETPNIAARLEGSAEPNTVTISAATQRLGAELFECDDLGPQRLKGISEPVSVFRVRGESGVASRFEAAAERGLTPLAGRKEEVGILQERWDFARSGEGQVVLLSGEAGIGKSRIVRDFRERIEAEAHNRVLYHCSPYHRNSALYPAINQLAQAMRFAPDDEPAQKLDKLETLLGNFRLSAAEVAPPLASLLSLPIEARYPRPNLNPEQLKSKMMEAIIAVIEAMAAQAPVLMVVEDTHWIDPSTVELLSLAIERLGAARALIVVTFRPEFEPPWARSAHVTAHALNRLGHKDCVAMVAELTGGKALPDEVLKDIIAKTDGIPLFVEELTKTVLESGLVVEENGSYALQGPLPPVAIPTSLQDSLMARLDRLASAKEAAQLAAVIGRTFSHDLLAAVSPLGRAALDVALNRLVGAGLIYRRGGLSPKVEYEFKHALVRDAAYESLLKSTRRQYHRRIAHFLEADAKQAADYELEIIAHHFAEARLADKAIYYLHEAGKRARDHSAEAEAVVHLQGALELLAALPGSEARTRKELDLILTLGPPLVFVKGPGPDVARLYARAGEICRHIGDFKELSVATFGLWLQKRRSGQYETALSLAEDLLGLADQSGDSGVRLQALHAKWTTHFDLGNMPAALEHAERGTALYDIEKHGDHAQSYGAHDPGVCAHLHKALSLWFLGHPDKALSSMADVMDLADRLTDAISPVIALYGLALQHQYRRDASLTARFASDVITYCDERDIRLYQGPAHIFQGWAMTMTGDVSKGLEECRSGLEMFLETGDRLRAPHYLTLMAECCERANQRKQALASLQQARNAIEETGERNWLAEVHRQTGELSTISEEAVPHFKRALDVARGQSAKLLELRAATSLARVWREQNMEDEASDLLAPVYGWFNEGFNTSDLVEAKALLDELS